MASQFKHPVATSLLLGVGRLADNPGWAWLNETIRKIDLQLLCPLLERYFRTKCSAAGLRLVPRHSVDEPGGFNPFLSDIDFSLGSQKQQSKCNREE